MVGKIATRGQPAPVQASRRWPVERTHRVERLEGGVAAVVRVRWRETRDAGCDRRDAQLRNVVGASLWTSWKTRPTSRST